MVNRVGFRNAPESGHRRCTARNDAMGQQVTFEMKQAANEAALLFWKIKTL
jgi:hypothetical protein